MFDSSFRRHYLLKLVRKHLPLLKGTVVDLGGKRGTIIDETQVVRYYILNIAREAQPDILALFPQIPLMSSSVDAVICTETLEYIYEFNKFLEEIYRILKPGGVFILSFPFLHPFHKDFQSDFYRFSESLIRYVFKKIGLEIMFFERMGSFPAVIYDLVRHYFSYRIFFSPYLSSFLLKCWKLSWPIFLLLDKFFLKYNFYCNTGYYVIGKKV